MAESTRTRRIRGLAWVLAAFAVAVAPHVPQLPAWVTLLLIAIGAWRWAADLRGWRLPPRWLRVIVVVAIDVAVLGTYRTFNGIEAGTAFLVLMAAVKLLETRAARDLTVLVFIAWFLLFAALLREPGPAAPAVAARQRVPDHGRTHARARVGRTGADAAHRAPAAALLLQAAPLALLLFLLFPRLPGPFWGIDSRTDRAHRPRRRNDAGRRVRLEHLGRSGVSRALPRRRLPPPEQRYWRGPVLHEFDGRSWRRPRAQAFPQPEVKFAEARPLRDHARAACAPLGACARPAVELAEREVFQSYRLHAAVGPAHQQRRVVRAHFLHALHWRARAAGDDAAQGPVVAAGRHQCPHGRAGSPARRVHGGDPRAIVADLLTMFREQPFEYTLQPPRLADNAIDEFLFTRARASASTTRRRSPS